MAQDDYDFCMARILRHEGGYSNNPKDPGGPTNYGITLKDYSAFLGRTASAADVRAMPLSSALRIYESKYEPACRFSRLRKGPDYSILDYDINSGVGRPPRVVQTLLKRPVTGRMDNDTVDAINGADPKWLIEAINAERLHFMHGIRGGASWAEFGGGWGTRVSEVQSTSLSLAAGGVSMTQATSIDSTRMAKAAHAPDPKVQGGIVTGTGGSAAGSGGAHASGGLSLEMALAIGAAVIIGGVIVWVVYHRRVAKMNNTVILPPGLVPRSF